MAQSAHFLLRAVALILGVVVAVLVITDSTDTKTAIVLLSVAMSLIGYSLIDEATGTKKRWFGLGRKNKR